MSQAATKPEPLTIDANRKVLSLAGGHAEVARILGYQDRRNVWPWTNDLKPFPPHHCWALELHFGADRISRQELRPHDWRKHWPDLPEPAAGAAKRWDGKERRKAA